MAFRTLCNSIALGLVVCLGTASPSSAIDEVLFRRDGKERQVSGRVVVEAQDGGVLLQAEDGVLWAIQAEEQLKHASDAKPFHPMSREEMSKRLLAELPSGFTVYSTEHYLICYDTSKAYAVWCGSLFEQLHMTFTNFWSKKGFDLHEPEFPLVAVVFADRQSYLKHSRAELGQATEAIIGYYALTNNRMTMYDLTGVEAQGHASRGRTAAQINQILSQPNAARTVATVVHEATHQIAFNCGLHTRLSDCPVWFCEGIAEYFETPDLRSAKGWKGIGGVNRARLEEFRRYCEKRPASSLETLIRDDKRFHDASQATEAYAEAWAVTHFLLTQRRKDYVAYLRTLSKKEPLRNDSPKTRIDEFREAFGDLKQLDADFLKFMAKFR